MNLHYKHHDSILNKSRDIHVSCIFTFMPFVAWPKDWRTKYPKSSCSLIRGGYISVVAKKYTKNPPNIATISI